MVILILVLFLCCNSLQSQYPLCEQNKTICVNITVPCKECFVTTISSAISLIPSSGGYTIYLVGKKLSSVTHYENVIIEKSSNISSANSILPYPHHEINLTPDDVNKPVFQIKSKWWKIHNGRGKLNIRSKPDVVVPDMHPLVHILDIKDGGVLLGPFNFLVEPVSSGSLICIKLEMTQTTDGIEIKEITFSSVNNGEIHQAVRISTTVTVSSPLSNSSFGTHKRFWIHHCEMKDSFKQWSDACFVYLYGYPWYGTVESNYVVESNKKIGGIVKMVSEDPIELRFFNNIIEIYFQLMSVYKASIVTTFSKNDNMGVLDVFNNLFITDSNTKMITIVESSDGHSPPEKSHITNVHNNLIIAPVCFFTVVVLEFTSCSGEYSFNRQTHDLFCTPPWGWANNDCLVNFVDGGNNTRGDISVLGFSNSSLPKPYPFFSPEVDTQGNLKIGPTTDFLSRPKKTLSPTSGPIEYLCPLNSCNYPQGYCVGYDYNKNQSNCSCYMDYLNEYISEGPNCECNRKLGYMYNESNGCICDSSRSFEYDVSKKSCVCNSSKHLVYDLDFNCVCEEGWLMKSPLFCGCNSEDHFVYDSKSDQCVCDELKHYVKDDVFGGCTCDEKNYFVKNGTEENCFCRTDRNFILNETKNSCSCGFEFDVSMNGKSCECSFTRGFVDSGKRDEISNMTICECNKNNSWVLADDNKTCSCDPSVFLIDIGNGKCGCNASRNFELYVANFSIIVNGTNSTNTVNKTRKCVCMKLFPVLESNGTNGYFCRKNDTVVVVVTGEKEEEPKPDKKSNVLLYVYIGSGSLLLVLILCFCCCCCITFLCCCSIWSIYCAYSCTYIGCCICFECCVINLESCLCCMSLFGFGKSDKEFKKAFEEANKMSMIGDDESEESKEQKNISKPKEVDEPIQIVDEKNERDEENNVEVASSEDDDSDEEKPSRIPNIEDLQKQMDEEDNDLEEIDVEEFDKVEDIYSGKKSDGEKKEIRNKTDYGEKKEDTVDKNEEEFFHEVSLKDNFKEVKEKRKSEKPNERELKKKIRQALKTQKESQKLLDKEEKDRRRRRKEDLRRKENEVRRLEKERKLERKRKLMEEKKRKKITAETMKALREKRELLGNKEYLEKIEVDDLLSFVMEDTFLSGVEKKTDDSPFRNEEERRLHSQIEVVIPIDPITPKKSKIQMRKEEKKRKIHLKKMQKIEEDKKRTSESVDNILKDFEHITTPQGEFAKSESMDFVDKIMSQFDLSDVTENFKKKK